MNKPIVSVCCLVYNHSPYLRQCLDGFIMQQTDFPFEIIVHDDASTDDSQSIIKDYQQRFPTLFRPILQTENQFSKNKGILVNIVFPQASGKYIALCEGDDYWTDPLKLQKQVNILEGDTSLMAVVTNSMVVDKEGGVLQKQFDNVVPENVEGSYDLHSYFRTAHHYPTASVVFRSIHSLEIREKFNHTLNRFLGDWTLWAILHLYGDFYYLDQVTTAYRINPTSLTHTVNRVKRAKAHFEICRKLKEVLPEEYGKYLKRGGWMYFSVFRAYQKEKKYLPAMGYLLWSLLRYPHFTIQKVYSLFKNKFFS